MKKIYLKLYNYIATKEVLASGINPWQIHSHICSVVSTGILMWGYAFLAYSEITFKTAGVVGFICSFIHLISPLFIRYLNSISIPSFMLIGSGLIHQSTFAHFSGGFSSNIFIWLGILPMLGGVIEGKSGTIKYFFLTVVVGSIFLFVEIFGPEQPDYLSDNGRIIAQAMMVFGWIFLSTVIIYVFNILNEQNEDTLKFKNQKIRNLVKILSHDLSNPIIIIHQRLRLGLKDDKVIIPKDKYLKIENILKNLRSMILNLREYEEIESGNKEITLGKVCIEDAIQYVLEMYSEKIYEKGITVKFFLPDKKIPKVYAEESSLKHHVISNIISNAIKFSYMDSDIHIQLSSKNKDVQMEVIDFGIGIPDYLSDSLFEMSYKTSRRGTNGETGSGFGLPIAKTYVNLFKGKMNASSVFIDDSRKTTFSLTLKEFVH